MKDDRNELSMMMDGPDDDKWAQNFSNSGFIEKNIQDDMLIRDLFKLGVLIAVAAATAWTLLT